MKKMFYILGLLVLVSSQQMTNAQIPPSHSFKKDQMPAAAPVGQVPGMIVMPPKQTPENTVLTPPKVLELKQSEANLMAAQTAAIQSLSKRIDDLTARVIQLETFKKQGGQP